MEACHRVALLARKAIAKGVSTAHEERVVTDAFGQPGVGVAEAEITLGEQLLARRRARALAERVGGKPLEAGKLTRLEVAIGGARLAAQRQDQARGELGKRAEVDALAGRGVDEAVVRGDDERRVAAVEHVRETGERAVERVEMPGDDIARDPVAMGERVELGVVGVDIGRLL